MIASKYCTSKGVGISERRLPSFDKALLDAGVGNYNLVRLSSILPPRCEKVDVADLSKHLPEGSLLPTAYSTISSDEKWTRIASAVAIGFPEDEDRVGVIMEYSDKGIDEGYARSVVEQMVQEAFEERGWKLARIETVSSGAIVETEGTQYTTFACVSEWSNE